MTRYNEATLKKSNVMSKYSFYNEENGEITLPKSASGKLGNFMNNCAEAWNLSQGKLLMLWMLPFVVVFLAAASALIDKQLYIWYTREDGFAEWLQVVFYIMAFIFCIIVTKHLFKIGEKGIAALYIVVIFGLFFMIGEELNWGQRIFGWETPESYQAINKQKETNLHNIYGVGYTFKWLQMVVGAYGTILPLLVFGTNAFRRFRDKLSWIVPHYSLIPFFVLLFVWRIFRNTVEVRKSLYFAVSEFNEVMELVFAIGMALFMIYQYRRIRSGKV